LQEFATWKKLTSHRQQEGHAVVSCTFPGCTFVTVAARNETSRGRMLMAKHHEDEPAHSAAGFAGSHSMLSLYELQAPLTPYVKSAFDEQRCVSGDSVVVPPKLATPDIFTGYNWRDYATANPRKRGGYY
jgi:hypothetical protein